jgi:hypothetical protein
MSSQCLLSQGRCELDPQEFSFHELRSVPGKPGRHCFDTDRIMHHLKLPCLHAAALRRQEGVVRESNTPACTRRFVGQATLNISTLNTQVFYVPNFVFDKKGARPKKLPEPSEPTSQVPSGRPFQLAMSSAEGG